MAAETYNTQQELLEIIASQLGTATATAVKAELGSIQDQIANIEALSKSDIDEVVAKINTISQVLDGDTDDEFSVENIIGILTDNKAAIETLQTSFSDLGTKISDVEASVAAVNSTIADLKSAYEAKVAELEGKYTDAQNALASVQNSVAANTTEIEAVKNSLLKIDDSVASGTSVFSSAKIEALIKEVQGQIDSKTEIDDSVVDAAKTFSSSKILSLIDNAKAEFQTAIDAQVAQAKNEAISAAVDQASANVTANVLTIDPAAIAKSFTDAFNAVMAPADETTESGDAATL